jgi:DNA-binding NarL/FixJ family response regulator
LASAQPGEKIPIWALCNRAQDGGVSLARARIVLADDYIMIIAAARSLLADEFDVVAEVGNGSQAVAAVLELDPDVLVTDISMPVLDGMSAVTRLKQANVRAKIVMLTMHEEPEFIKAALSAGALGYVTKTRFITDLIPAIREVLLGNIYVSPITQQKG